MAGPSSQTSLPLRRRPQVTRQALSIVATMSAFPADLTTCDASSFTSAHVHVVGHAGARASDRWTLSVDAFGADYFPCCIVDRGDLRRPAEAARTRALCSLIVHFLYWC